MSEQTVELYGDTDIERMKKRVRRWTAVLAAVGAAALAVCVVLAARTGTLNAMRMELSAVAVSTVAGWIIIYFGVFKVGDGRRELRHVEMLRTEERERVEGTVTVMPERFRIRKSVPVRRVEVRSADGQVRRLLVCESRARALENANAGAVYAAHGYAAAYEVTK